MHLRVFAILSLSVPALWAVASPAAQRYMSVDEVRPGMVGVGRTVFQGSEIEEFTVRIISVLRNNVGPRRDLILAHLEGGPLAKTGVIAGMSGSPVYIDGRLVGAVAYSLGSFPTEPIAGITPIGEMIDATRSDGATAVRVAPIPADATPAALLSALRAAIRPPLPFASPGAGAITLTTGSLDPNLVAQLRPIATPLSFGSMAGAAADQIIGALGPAGFVPVLQAAQSAPTEVAGELRPGDPVGVALVTGDLSVAATGTVTEVDGRRVYAFGHSFFNLGTARLPMTRAYVHTILPSLMTSTKVASTGDIIGTIVQDRVTAVAGIVGEPPGIVPLSVTIRTERGGTREIALTLADDPFLTPLFTLASLLNTFGSYERELGSVTYALRATISIRDGGILSFDDVLTGESASMAAAGAVAVPIGALMTNSIEAQRVERIDIDVTTSERPRLATIQRAWLDSADVRPGRQVPLKVHLRTWRGADVLKSIPIDVPADVAGPLTLMVADAQRLSEWEQRESRPPVAPASIAQLLRQLRGLRRNNVLYVRLSTQADGAIVQGEPLPALPSSVLTVLRGDRSSSGSSAMRSVVVGSWDIPMDEAISGMRTLSVPHRRNGRRP